MNDRSPSSWCPAGWYAVAYSDELPTGAVLPVHYFGRELVLYRTDSGKPVLADAFCPHLGAHLGHGGTVTGDRLKCPFHSWCFDTDGRCVEIPYAARIPPRAELKVRPTCERNGLVMAYYHPEGAAPTYEVPVVVELETDEWTPPRRLHWTVRSNNHEICENVTDTAHIKFVHGVHVVPDVGSFETDGAALRFDLQCQGLSSYISLHGLGILQVQNHTDFGLGEGVYQHTMYITPVDEMEVEIRHLLTVKREGDEERTRAVEDSWEKAVFDGFSQDVPIFEHKGFEPRPVLCEEDGPIMQYRQWAKQFYIESAETS